MPIKELPFAINTEGAKGAYQYSGFSQELGGYAWVVMHPKMPSSVKEVVEQEFLDKKCWGDVYQNYLELQKAQAETFPDADSKS